MIPGGDLAWHQVMSWETNPAMKSGASGGKRDQRAGDLAIGQMENFNLVYSSCLSSPALVMVGLTAGR